MNLIKFAAIVLFFASGMWVVLMLAIAFSGLSPQ